MDLIKSVVLSSYLVSATILDNTLKDDIYSKNIYIIDPPPNYKGIPNLICTQIPASSKAISYQSIGKKADQYENYHKSGNLPYVGNSIFSNDQFLKKYLNRFNTLPHQGLIPNITLLKNINIGIGFSGLFDIGKNSGHLAPKFNAADFSMKNLASILSFNYKRPVRPQDRRIQDEPSLEKLSTGAK